MSAKALAVTAAAGLGGAMLLATALPTTASASSGTGTGVRKACTAAATATEAQCLALVRTGLAQVRSAAPDVTVDGYGPGSIQSAYKLASAAKSRGSGEVVAVVDAFNDPNAGKDLNAYRKHFGLPACTSANKCFRKVNQNGKASPLPVAAGSSGWDVEESLDIDMVSAVCPKCRIVLVETNSNQDISLARGVNGAIKIGARFVSNSYSSPQAKADSSLEHYYNHPGSAVTASAGDSGWGTGYPATSRFVTSVGGTALTKGGGGSRGWSESVWGDGSSGSDGDGTGSGCATFEKKPSWQHATGCKHRIVSDVSAVADPNTGVAVFDTYSQAGWLVVGGTSASSPIIAATYALAGRPARGDTPAWYPYHHTTHLFDVTSGSNGTGCNPAYLCNGEVGYDGPTGLGTPNGIAAFKHYANSVKVKSPGSKSATRGHRIGSFSIHVSDNDPTTHLSFRAFSLPAGLHLSRTGVIYGTPTHAATYHVTIRVTDTTGAHGSVTFTFKVKA